MAALLLIYRPQKDDRLSWFSWLICTGWFASCGPTKSRREPSGRRPEPSGRRPELSGHCPDAAQSRPDIVRRPTPPGAVQRPPHETGKCPRIRLQLGVVNISKL